MVKLKAFVLIAVCLALTAGASAEITDNVVAHFDFDDVNAGSPSPATPYYWNNALQPHGLGGYWYGYSGWSPDEVAGKFVGSKGGPGAVQFTGANSDYLYNKWYWDGNSWDFWSAKALPHSGTGFSVSIWSMLPGDPADGANVLSGDRDSTLYDSYQLGYDNDGAGNISARFTLGTAEAVAPIADTSTWHNLIGTWDGVDTINLYLNGALVDTTTDAAGTAIGLDNQDGTMAMGWTREGGYLDCTLDDMGIWNRELSLTDAEYLWNNGDGNTVPEPMTLTLLGIGGLGLLRRRKK